MHPVVADRKAVLAARDLRRKVDDRDLIQVRAWDRTAHCR
jgi:hypothetical protein